MVAPSEGFELLEIVRVRRGRIELATAHARRLAASARALTFVEPPEESAILQTLREYVARNAVDDERIELRLARDGVASRLTVRAAPSESFGVDELASGLALAVASIRRDPSATTSRHKTTDRRVADVALADAKRSNADEALILNLEGRVAGAARANVFVLRDDGLVTPPVSEGALPGVMRAALLAAAATLQVAAREAPLALDDVRHAPDVLLTASAHGLLSVRSIDGRPLEPPSRGSRRKGLVPRLRLRVHELGESDPTPR